MVKTENCLYMVCAYSVYAFFPICAQFNISTLHIGSCKTLLAQETRLESLNSGNQRNRDLKNGEERVALLPGPTLIIDGVLRGSAANRECSMYRAIS